MIPYIHEVKYYECDRMGVTHHSNYIRFMEEARVYVQDQLGYGFEKMEAEGVVSPVTALSCEFKKTTTFKDKIEINLKVKEQSPLKITFSYVMDNIPYVGKLYVPHTCRAPRMGETITVSYDPANPKKYACYAFGPAGT